MKAPVRVGVLSKYLNMDEKANRAEGVEMIVYRYIISSVSPVRRRLCRATCKIYEIKPYVLVKLYSWHRPQPRFRNSFGFDFSVKPPSSAPLISIDLTTVLVCFSLWPVCKTT